MQVAINPWRRCFGSTAVSRNHSLYFHCTLFWRHFRHIWRIILEGKEICIHKKQVVRDKSEITKICLSKKRGRNINAVSAMIRICPYKHLDFCNSASAWESFVHEEGFLSLKSQKLAIWRISLKQESIYLHKDRRNYLLYFL